MQGTITIKEALAIATKSAPHHEAKLILAHYTGLTATELILKNHQPLDETAKGAFFAAIERRVANEPLQYILGDWEFMGLKIKTDSRALIPRPETELLVEEALKHITTTHTRILDICTGSGCIAIAIAKLSGTSVTATDISQKALSLAKENAELHGLTNKIHFIQSDLLNDLNSQHFDIIISNPPYIPTAELSTLQPELTHEPTLALDGGPDGLAPYRKLIPQARDFLPPGGNLLLEIGPPTVEAIMKAAGYGMIRTINDYAGLPRIITGTINK